MEEEKKYELVKFVDGELELEVNVSPDEETIWLSQGEMSVLFDVDRTRITRHISNIFKEGELNEKSNVRKTHITNTFKPTILYSLDVIISVGYRVKSKRGVIFRKWANKVLKDYLMKGYVINENRIVASNENFNNLLVVVNDIKSNQVDINNRLIKVENKVFNNDYGLDKIFYNGQFYDAYTLIQSIFESANNEIIIIDNYIDRTILDRLIVKKQNVKVLIYTDNNKSQLLQTDINTFNKQYGLLTIKNTTNVHDRYIVIDQDKLYHIGASVKDLGKKIFSIIESDSNMIPNLLKSL